MSKIIHNLFLAVIGIIFLISLVVPLQYTNASGIPVKCGDTINGEFTGHEDGTWYEITLAPLDEFTVSGNALGDQLTFNISLGNTTGGAMGSYGNWSSHPQADSGVLSAHGTYSIYIQNAGAGVYSLTITCKLHSPLPPANSNTNTTNSVPAFGFPGLAPVDFANVASLPLQDGWNNGAITPTSGEILGFTFSGKASNGLDLSFKRASGNLNLGLVVLLSGNSVVFQTSLITSDTLSTHFVLPADGTYTIGVFKIDLLPPDKPQPTAFQIQAKVGA